MIPLGFKRWLKPYKKTSPIDEANIRQRLEKDAESVQIQANQIFRITDQPGPGRMDALGTIHNTMAWIGTGDPRNLDSTTAPYLHNGSVRNMYELLSPAAERSKQLYVTREFDPVKLGLNIAVGKPTDYLLDTTIIGNSNAGHSFEGVSGPGVIGREFKPAERFALIEYLKSIPNVEGRVTLVWWILMRRYRRLMS